MSYRGTADVTGLPELTSVRRMREAGAMPPQAPPQQQPQVQQPPPPKPKACANCGSPLNQMGECSSCGEASEADEGGAGSGSQGGKKKGIVQEIAEKHGYKVSGVNKKSGNTHMKGENGENLIISSNSQDWTHGSPERGVTPGQGARDLHAHLMHGDVQDEG